MRDANKTVVFIVLGAALAVACSFVTKEQKDKISFSHHLHSEQGVECGDCHGAVAKDRAVKVQAIPGKDGCSDCHDVEDESGCNSCHANYERDLAWPRARKSNLLFSHEMHADFEDDCSTCHQGAAHWPDLSTSAPTNLTHDSCRSCHDRELSSGRCALCHYRLDLSAKRPQEFYSHEGDFFKNHGVKAQGGADTCAQCHEQTYCADCHDQTMTRRPSIRYPEAVGSTFVHRGDYISRHVMEARLDDTGCFKCHGTSFCAGCHEQLGVGGALGVKNPHAGEPNWVIATGGASGPSEHGRQARRRINECASCHDQGPVSNCVPCHKSGGHNPHPPGWAPPAAGDKNQHKMCRICHSL